MKYSLNINWQDGGSGKHNASSKARVDVRHTLADIGCKCIDISIRRPKESSTIQLRCAKILLIVKLLLQMVRYRLGRRDIVYIQYPIMCKADKLTVRLLRLFKVQLVAIVHDLEFLRFNMRESAFYELALLGQMDAIMVHTERMSEVLRENGISHERMRVMTLFDYYSKSEIIDSGKVIQNRKSIAFAGNLLKSGFVHKIKEMDSPEITFRLYGVFSEALNDAVSNNVEYAGCFDPDKPDSLLAGWGLVWDGNSVLTCDGRQGNYLRYNSSHKISLYLSTGFPVIVWKESGLAEWVLSNKLGIAVDNLNDIQYAVDSVSDNDYCEMIRNVRTVAIKLREGGFLKEAIISFGNERY